MPEAAQAEISDYNYPRFNRNYVAGDFIAPEPGDMAPELTATDLDGNPVDLESFRGRPVVLETGSMTCPQTIGNVKGMNELAERHPDSEFLQLYVREAHPGSNLPPMMSTEEKLQRARDHVKMDSESRTILVDTIDGVTHARYGLVPNAIFLIDRDGRIVLNSEWNRYEKLEPYIDALEHDEPIDPDVDLGFNPHLLKSAYVWRRSGFDALRDAMLTMPFIIIEHVSEFWQKIKKRRSS